MTAFNIALIAVGVSMAAIGGWRGTRDAATLVPQVEHQEIIKDHIRYRFVDDRWTVSDRWSGGVEIEYYDDTKANPDEEGYRKQDWIGGRVEMRATRYWALRLWPATWRYVDIGFAAPDEVMNFWSRDGEYFPAGVRPLARRITISAADKILTFELTRQQIEDSGWYPKGSRRNPIGWWKWHQYLRRTSADGFAGITLRGNDAKAFFDLVLSVAPETPITLKADYFEYEINTWRPLASHSFTMPAPSAELWASAPEVPIQPIPTLKAINGGRQ